MPQLPTEFFEEAGAYEELVQTKGFSYLKAYYQAQVRAFTNKAVMEGFKSMEEYKEARGEINGIRKLLGHIDHTLQTLEKHRKEQNGQETA